jgi:hypothetical protein
MGSPTTAQAAILKYTARGFLLQDRAMVGGPHAHDKPRNLADGKAFSLPFEAGKVMEEHQYHVSWMLSRLPLDGELCRYPETTGIVGWIEVDGDRVYQRAPMTHLVWLDD